MSRQKFFHGYWVLACSFLFILLNAGCGPGCFSLFVRALQADLGWGRAEIMAAFTIFFAVMGVTSPFAGRLVDRYGARSTFSMGALLAVAGHVLVSQMTDLWQFYLGYILLGAGFTAVGPVTTSYVVSHWFRKRRGMAIGIMSMGMPVSLIVFPPLIAVYLIPHFGWSNTYLTFAALEGGLIIPLSILVVRTKPADVGLCPDGMEPPGKDPVNTSTGRRVTTSAFGGLPLKLAVATPAFWLLAASLVLTHNFIGIFQSAFPHLRDMGFPAPIAAVALSIHGTVQSVGMFFFGWLCDRIRVQYAAAIGIGLIALGILIFIFIRPGSPVQMVWMYAAVLAFGAGSWMPTMSMLTSSIFGIASYGAVFGMLSLFQNMGAGIGPLIAGYVYDTRHDYFWAFVIILAMVVAAMPLVLAVKRPVSK
jgi:MFS family permease